MEKEKILFEAVLVIGLLLLGWVAYSAVVPGSGGTQIALKQNTPPPSECGDVNDPKNIQHLSHHPDRYKECYKYVDPQKFKDAVGEDISNYMG